METWVGGGSSARRAPDGSFCTYRQLAAFFSKQSISMRRTQIRILANRALVLIVVASDLV